VIISDTAWRVCLFMPQLLLVLIAVVLSQMFATMKFEIMIWD